MNADPSIECNLSDHTYAKLRMFAIVCLAVYGAGIPLLFMVVLIKYRKEIKVDQVTDTVCGAVVVGGLV